MGLSIDNHRIASSASSSPSSTKSSLADSLLHDLDVLAPRCAFCRMMFDARTRLPFLVAPCLHTVCASCFRQPEKKKRRRPHVRCAKCSSKCTTVALNVVVLSLAIRLKMLAAGAIACGECRRTLPHHLTRRCRTCELEVLQKTAITRASCVICVECALDNHRSHHLERYSRQPLGASASRKTSKSSRSSDATSLSSLSLTARTTPSRDVAPKTPLQKVISLPLRFAGGLLRKVFGEQSTLLDYLYHNTDKQSAMNLRHFATSFDMRPKSNRYKNSKENFWWSLSQEAVRIPPFLLDDVDSGKVKERKSWCNTSQHVELTVNGGANSKSAMAVTYQLLADDLLLKRRDQHLAAATAAAAISAAASRQLFYSNADFRNYVNVTRASVPESRKNNFNNFAAQLADTTATRCRNRDMTVGLTTRKCPAPSPTFRVPLTYSKIV